MARDLGRSGQNKSWGTENRKREQIIIFLDFEQCELKLIRKIGKSPFGRKISILMRKKTKDLAQIFLQCIESPDS